MPDLTPELNLNLALDDDDTADYLTINLSDSLTVLDGLFNSGTGHAHNGAHQGGALEFLDLTVGQDLTVVGQSILQGPVLVQSSLHVVGTSTFDGPLNLAQIDAVFDNTVATPNSNYTVATKIMWVYALAAIAVTLPAAVTADRPITVVAVTGNSTITAAGGSVIGGSVDLVSGAIQNGVCNQGDSLTYKSDGTNWRVV